MARDRVERNWIVGTALLSLVVAAVGWLFLISPQRDETDQRASQLADAQLQNTVLQGRIGSLADERAKLKQYAARLQAAQQALPESTDMSAFLRNVQAIAAASSTKVTAVNVEAPTPVDPAAGAAPSTGSSTPSGTGSTGSTAAATGTTGGIFAIPITASVTGTPTALSVFLAKLQAGQPRAVLISQITRGSDSDRAGARSTLQLTMQAFVAPPAAPTAPTAAPSSTGG